jgi:hypothetical protein
MQRLFVFYLTKNLKSILIYKILKLDRIRLFQEMIINCMDSKSLFFNNNLRFKNIETLFPNNK